MVNLEALFMVGFPVPGGETKTLWELMFDPFTRYLHNYFFLSLVMIIAMVIWFRTESAGPPILWMIISSGSLTMFLTTGEGAMFFGIITILSLTVAGVRLVVQRL